MKRILLYLCLGLFFWSFPQDKPVYTERSESVQDEPSSLKMGLVGPENKITLHFKDEDLGVVLQLLAEETGLNIAISQDIEGKVTVDLTEVSLETALKTITLITECDYIREDNIIIISKKGKIKNITRMFRLEHIDGGSVKDSITHLLSPNGKMFTFIRAKGIGNEKNQQRSNIVIVTDTPDKIEEIASMIKLLDTPAPQVLIQAELIEVNVKTLSDLGINWNLEMSMNGPTLASTFPVPRTNMSGKYVLPVSGGLVAQTGEFKAGQLSYGQFSSLLRLIQTLGPDANVLAQPRVATMDNQEAEIVIGDIIPIPSYTYNDQRAKWEITGYSDQKVGITLTVTPHITTDGQIMMTVKPEVSEIVGWVAGPSGQNEKPLISTRRADTQVRVRNNDTIVIGGLIKTVATTTESKVPLLGDIPLLGLIFRSKSVNKQKVDLLIFITPHILTEEKIKEMTQEGKTRLEKTNTEEKSKGK